jgi:hypothetical protein
MVNLLSQEDKQLLLGDYWRRRLVVGGCLLATLLFVSNILMLALYFVAGYRLAATEKLHLAESAQAGTKELMEQTSVAAALKTDLEMFKQAEQAVSGPQFALVAGRLESRRVPGIKVMSIDFTNDAPQTVRVSLRGVSSSRKALTGYIESLRTDPGFSAVESPIANLLRDTASSFTINLVVVSEGLATPAEKKI